jgi:retron-type reverse transcriptase
LSTLKNIKNATTLDDLAAILGYKPSSISYIIYKIPDAQKYSKFKIPKRSGGEREISAPTAQLKRLQQHLANALYVCRDEIDAKSGRRPLSHAFRRKHSIVTNARRHKRRRYVLNLDLQDFFPTFNFGRVRGFFIHNNDFKLHEKVATIIAQIACFENTLPQGSPCSPIIADLIAHMLDVRLAQLAKQHQLTYSRYADDITFSTSRKEFPAAVAAPVSVGSPQWALGADLTKVIQKAGFTVNPNKTRMQFKMSRQLVTGLTVNTKVNIRSEYYRLARAMCHRLFKTGAYRRPAAPSDGGAKEPEVITSLGPIGGILSHIHHVKNKIEDCKDSENRKDATAARRLYARFLKYRYFVRLERPLIICEGKTDNIYLKYAIRNLSDFHPNLGTFDGKIFKSVVDFFNHGGEASRVLDLGGGTGALNYFFIKKRYYRDIRSFKHRPLKHPVIVLVDNDEGARDLLKLLSKNYNIKVNLVSTNPFFHITDNLYLVKTPEKGTTGSSCIEDFFDPSLLATKVDGKKFNPKKDHGADGEYGKFVFAEKVVRPNAGMINFAAFAPLLERIVAVINHYHPPAD